MPRWNNRFWAGGWNKVDGRLVQCYENLNNTVPDICLYVNSTTVCKFDRLPERESNYKEIDVYKRNALV